MNFERFKSVSNLDFKEFFAESPNQYHSKQSQEVG